MKQTQRIEGECQHATPKWLCARDATWGLYRVPPGDIAKVELDIPARIFCGQHKQAVKLHPLFTPDLRYVRLNAKL